MFFGFKQNKKYCQRNVCKLQLQLRGTLIKPTFFHNDRERCSKLWDHEVSPLQLRKFVFKNDSVAASLSKSYKSFLLILPQ